MIGSVRHQIRIARPADDVWTLAGDPTRIHEWFPGITACTVDGNQRVITTGTGMPMPEEILVKDDVQRRFQYRITAPLFQFHRGTIDVIDLEDDTCLVVYSTDADPRTMALVISGGAAGALDELKRQMEQHPEPHAEPHPEPHPEPHAEPHPEPHPEHDTEGTSD